VIAANGGVLFAGYDATYGTELWKSDGTTSGTSILKDINTGTLGPLNQPDVVRFVAMNGSIYFTVASQWLGAQLWKTTGGPGSTVLVAQLEPPGPQAVYSVVQDLTVVGNTLFFVAYDPSSYTFYLWKSDGTTAGTAIVPASFTGDIEPIPENLIRFNGELYFDVYDNVSSNASLWKSDGTAAGTVMVADPGGVNSFVIAHNLLFFLNGNDQLWVSDGTTAGTQLLQNLGVNPPSISPGLFALKGELYYSSNADGQGWQLWKTDGTAAGTQLVKVLTPGADALPTNFANVDGVIYFVANDGTGGYALWKSDGTATGTQMVMDFSAPNGYGRPDDLTNLNGRLFFTAGDGQSSPALWQSDGTAAGTTIVTDIGKPLDHYPYTRDFTVLDGLLFFVADDGVHGQNLWESDGTQAGTFMVPGIRREGGANVSALTHLWNKLFFIADDGIHGMEPWIIAVTTTSSSPAIPAQLFGASASAKEAGTDSPTHVHSRQTEGSFPLPSAVLPRNSADPVIAPSRSASRLRLKQIDAFFSLPWDEREKAAAFVA
jgi:ELWxxDGT repeat protein